LESEKAKANRQLRCQNEEKMTCCYVCLSRRECAVSCNFLGDTENQGSPVEPEKNRNEDAFSEDKKDQDPQTEKAPAVCCSLCNAEMSQTRTKFRIDRWEGTHLNEGEFGDELQVRVYLCPQCGKIEFKALMEDQNKE
jgi:hypothetical protein